MWNAFVANGVFPYIKLNGMFLQTMIFQILYVCTLLSHGTDDCNSADASQLFICNVCKMCLLNTNNISPSVPIYSHNPIARSGAQFLKALQEKPEYICTCCHRMLFRRLVARFHMSQISLSHIPL